MALRSATRTAPTPPPDPTERRTAWLSSWGAFASAIAAVVGLVVSAVATYYTGLALRDQQAINKDQNEREHRSQALQVGFWYTNSQSNKGEVAVVSNRSPDAIYQLTVRFTFVKWPSDPISAKESSLKVHEVKAEYTSASLPPCTQLVFTKKTLHAAFDLLAKQADADVEQPLSTALVFGDARGAKWARGTTLRELSSLEGFGMAAKNFAQRIRSGELVAEFPNGEVATTRPEPNCGNS
ncbi:hypothetical protein ACFVXW_25100 [Streptomyces sp. NPDC058251]|uniref:hypothetical protein n=1 Tax=Streptomyces sp. NPDC058251 TaxID=3346404 RepID=UPI0036EEED9E